MAKLGTEALAMATIAQKTKQPLPGIPDITTNGDQPMVNRKKQKRREKQAAKLAATQTHATLTSKSSHRINGTSHVKSVTSAVTTVSYQHVNGSRANHPEDDDELFYTDDELE